MAISSIGVGSGLPLDQLLEDLRKSENVALTANMSRQARAESQISAYSTLKNALESLNKAASDLTKTDTYGALKASVTGDAYSASVSNQAIPGEYSIQVEHLARSQTLVTTGVADRTEAIGSGGIITFTLNDGSSKTLDLSESGSSLNDIVKAINDDNELGFNATLINDGDPATPHRLLLTARDTGAMAGASSISVDGNPELHNLLKLDALDVQDGTDAVLHINGITITSASNTVENAIEGVTLSLNTPSDVANRLSVTNNDSVTSDAINKFVTAYNHLHTTISALTRYDIENQQSSALTGDSLTRRLQSDVRNAINAALPDGNVSSLSHLGITTNVTSGLLEVDDTKLADALKHNMNDVESLLAGTNGVGSRINAVTDTFNRSGGLIEITTDGIDRRIADLKKQYQISAERIDAKMENYRRQFTSLDTMVAQMNSVSSYLTQQLSMLGNIGKEK